MEEAIIILTQELACLWQ